jgi:hypothetical protein
VSDILRAHGLYDVSPDGLRIYFFDRRREPPPSEFGVVVGWREMLK